MDRVREYAARKLESKNFLMKKLSQREMRTKMSFREYCQAVTKKNNMIYIPILGDGSCQYSSIIVGLNHLGINIDGENHTLDARGLRSMLADYVLQLYSERDEKLVELMRFADEGEPLSVSEFLIRIQSRDGGDITTWGNHATLILMARLFEIEIVVARRYETEIGSLKEFANQVNTYPDDVDGSGLEKPRIFLLYDDSNHYEAAVLDRSQPNAIAPSTSAELQQYRGAFRLKKLPQKNCLITAGDVKKSNESAIISAINNHSNCSIEYSQTTGKNVDAGFNAVIWSLRDQGYNFPPDYNAVSMRVECHQQYQNYPYRYINQARENLVNNETLNDYLKSILQTRRVDDLIFRLICDSRKIAINIISFNTFESGLVLGNAHYAKTSVRVISGSMRGPCAFIANVQTLEHNKFYPIVPSGPALQSTINIRQSDSKKGSVLAYDSDSSIEISKEKFPQSIDQNTAGVGKNQSNVKRKSSTFFIDEFDSRSNSPQFGDASSVQGSDMVIEENSPRLNTCSSSNEDSRDISPYSLNRKTVKCPKENARSKRQKVIDSTTKTIICDCDIVKKKVLGLDKDVLDYQRYTKENFEMKTVSRSQCSKVEQKVKTRKSLDEVLLSRFQIVNKCKVSENEHNDCFRNAHSQYYAVLDSLRLQGFPVDETLSAGKLRYLCYQEYVENQDLYKDLMDETTNKLGISKKQYLDRMLRHHPGDDLSLKLLASVLQINISVAVFDFEQNTRTLDDKIVVRNIFPQRIVCRANQIHRKSFIYQVGTNYFRIHISIMPNARTGAQITAMENLSEKTALPFKSNVDYGYNEKDSYYAELCSQVGKVFDEQGKLFKSIKDLPLYPKEYNEEELSNSIECMEVDSEMSLPTADYFLLSPLSRVNSPAPSNVSSSSASEQKSARNKRYRNKRTADKLRNNEEMRKSWPYDYNITTEIRNMCMQDFLEKTSDDCLKLNVCFTCGIREFDSSKVKSIDFNEFKKSYYNVLKKTTSRESITSKSAFRPNISEDLEAKDFNAIDFFIEKKGVDEVTSNGLITDLNFTICDSCFKSFKGRRISPTAILNNNYYGDVPEALQGLTIVEEILVSRVRAVMCVMTLRDGGGNKAYRCLRGNCVAFPQDQISISKLLPQSLDSIGEYLQIVFVGQTIPTESEALKRVLRVRKVKVREAIDCLINSSNGRLTHQTVFNENTFNTLPEDGIPDQVLKDIDLQSDPKVAEREDAAHAAYYNNSSELLNQLPAKNLDNVDEEGEEEPIYHINQYGQVDSDGVGINEETRIREALVQLNIDSINHVKQKRSTKNPNANSFNVDSNDEEECDDAENPINIDEELNCSADDSSEDDEGLLRNAQNTIESIRAITRDRDPVNEYNNSELWYDAFPSLFPNRLGAPEGIARPFSRLSLHLWIKHALQIADPRFRLHPRFILYVSNMLKRREVSKQAKLKYSSTGLTDVLMVMESLTVQELSEYVLKAQNKEPISDVRIKKIIDNLKSVGGKVKGSTFSRAASRIEIMSLQLYEGLSKFFVTINPYDYDSPILLFFNGIKKNISEPFDKALEYIKRKEIVINDPVSASSFFDLIIRTFIHSLLGYKSEKGGILGHVTAYYGTVETQGRGTLHYHSLIWLSGFPSAAKFITDLDNKDFQEAAAKYIDQTITATLKPKEELGEVDLFRKIKPNDAEFNAQVFENTAMTSAYGSNIHNHSFTCYKNDPKQLKCRFNFTDPGKELVDQTLIKKSGEVKLRRTHPYINQFNMAAMYCIRSNMDFNFIVGSKDARALAVYITDYITKNNLSTHNLLAVIAVAHKTITDPETGEKVANKVGQKMITKCINKINVLHEHSSPELAHFLLGFPDHYTGTTFSPIYVGQIFNEMKILLDHEEVRENNDFHVEATGRKLVITNQYIDYVGRGQSLNDLCLYEFTETLTKRKITRNPRGLAHRFVDTHPQAKTHHMVNLNEPVVPTLLKIPPRQRDDSDVYERMVLLLLIPFRHPTDLLFNQSSWKDAYKYVIAKGTISDRMWKIYLNLKDIHGAMEQREIDNEKRANEEQDEDFLDNEGNDIERPPRQFIEEDENLILDEDLRDLQDELEGDRLGALEEEREKYLLETNSAWNALGKLLEVDHAEPFTSNSHDRQMHYSNVENLIRARVDKKKITYWRKQILLQQKQELERISMEGIDVDIEDSNSQPNISSINPNNQNLPVDPPINIPIVSDEYLSKMNNISDAAKLNTKQKLAYEIVAKHLIQFLTRKEEFREEPLRLIITGEGGTGKSTVIHAIREFFNAVEKSAMLSVTGSTGKSASLIGGETIYSKIRWRPNCTVVRRSEALIINWQGVYYLVIDEISMVGSQILKIISDAISIAKSAIDGKSFGNISVILVGDFNQLQPVRQQSLMKDPQDPSLNNAASFGTLAILGLQLFHGEFRTVINLDQPMRQANDPKFHELLKRLRVGKGTDADFEFLNSKVIPSLEENPDFRLPNLFETKIIVMTNKVKDRLNEELIEIFARNFKQEMITITATDVFRPSVGVKITPTIKELMLKLSPSYTQNLPGILSVTVGMPIVATSNISVTLGITNGTTGFVREIIFDPSEPHTMSNSFNKFKTTVMPLTIIVEFPDCKFKLPDQISENCFPVIPSTFSFRYTFSKATATTRAKYTDVSRRTFPLVANFASTNHKCQGDTFTSAIVDLQTGPPTKTSAGAYVAISRLKESINLYILRPFKKNVIQRGVNIFMSYGMNRLLKDGIETMKKYTGLAN